MTATPCSAEQIYSILIETYGPQAWWPGDSPLEIMVGAVLTQNTAWSNVAIAIARLQSSDLLTLDALLSAGMRDQGGHPTGRFHNVKYDRLTALLHFVRTSGGIDGLMRWPTEALLQPCWRSKASAPKPQTVSCSMSWEAGLVVDKYTRRLLMRLGHAWRIMQPTGLSKAGLWTGLRTTRHCMASTTP